MEIASRLCDLHMLAIAWRESAVSVGGFKNASILIVFCTVFDMIKKLSAKEIFEALEGSDWPPIMTLEEASLLLKLKPSTLYRHLSEGRYASSVKRGKPVRFWRDRLIQEFMR